jgi:hypothetical protein
MGVFWLHLLVMLSRLEMFFYNKKVAMICISTFLFIRFVQADLLKNVSFDLFIFPENYPSFFFRGIFMRFLKKFVEMQTGFYNMKNANGFFGSPCTT